MLADRSISHRTWSGRKPHLRHGAQNLALAPPNFRARHGGVMGDELGVRGKLGAFYDASSLHDDAVVAEELTGRQRLFDLDELVKLNDRVLVQDQVKAPSRSFRRT